MYRAHRAEPAVNGKVAGSRKRLLALLAAGDADGTAREMESHLANLQDTGRVARHPAMSARAQANRAWVRDTVRRKDPRFAELLDHVLCIGAEPLALSLVSGPSL
jgi:hypothetical protein